MNRPSVEVADILHAQGDRFVEKNRSWLSFQQMTVLRAIGRCRTAALGGHVDSCPRCGHQAISYNSCRNRHCPKCQAQARQRWLAAREQELLGVPYFHVVFTLPHELNRLCRQNQALLYNLLFQTSAATMQEVAADPKHMGAEIGFLTILHTWGQNLLLHPHVHCAIPAGGFSFDRTQWLHPRYPFFLPVKVLGRVFRGKFVSGLRRLYRQKRLHLAGDTSLEQPKQFATFLRTLFRQDWVVYAKPAFGGPAQVLRYLGRYTHRVAISNHRLLEFDGQRVTFRWKDYAHGGKHRKMTLDATEFLRRLVQHILPRGFVRIRPYGFLANRRRASSISLARQLVASGPMPREPCPDKGDGPASWQCPRCGTTMQIGPNLTPRQLASRCTYFDSS
jgi:Putative transposase/Transposase zinc-binding domain